MKTTRNRLNQSDEIPQIRKILKREDRISNELLQESVAQSTEKVHRYKRKLKKDTTKINKQQAENCRLNVFMEDSKITLWNTRQRKEVHNVNHIYDVEDSTEN